MKEIALRARRVLEHGSCIRLETRRLHSSSTSSRSCIRSAVIRTRCSASGGDPTEGSRRRPQALQVSRAVGSLEQAATSSDFDESCRAAPIRTSDSFAAGQLSEADWQRALENANTDFVAETLLPTRSGKFRVRAYRHQFSSSITEPSAIIKGDVEGRENVPVRVHDACFTSEVLGSLKCDCAEQLQLSLDYMQEHDGMVIYLQQEGRGIGLANKIAAYALQEQGYDTVDANRALGLPDDCREYTSVKHILEDLGIKSIKLMTNNPRKVNTMSRLGVDITGRIPCIIPGNDVNQGYLETKVTRMSHDLDELSDSDLMDDEWEGLVRGAGEASDTDAVLRGDQ